jgi:hypothetical protein
VLAGLVATVWLLAHPPRWLDPAGTVALLAVSWALFSAGAWLIRRTPSRTAAVLVLLGGVILPLAAGFGSPRSSDDLYRYQWDGRVQAAGIDPYRYPPAAPELVPLRDPVLWPERSAWCVPPGASLAAGCTLINRPTVHTIYPPVAQAYFLAVHAMSVPGAGYRPVQLAAALAAIATTLLVLSALPRLGIDRRGAVLWAWCPTVALEAGNNGHIDVLAALLSAGALIALSRAGTRRRSAVGGVLLGLAIATKLTPALVVPAVLRRRPLTVLVATAGAVAAVYLPHILAVGAGVIGYFPGYLNEEGYANGSRFALLTLVLPGVLAAPAAMVILAGVAVAAARHTDPQRPWRGAVVTTAVALLVTTPTYPWYAVLLVLLVAFDGRAAWLAVAAAGYLAQHGPDVHLQTVTAQRLGYGAAALAVFVANRLVVSGRPRPDGRR